MPVVSVAGDANGKTLKKAKESDDENAEDSPVDKKKMHLKLLRDAASYDWNATTKDLAKVITQHDDDNSDQVSNFSFMMLS